MVEALLVSPSGILQVKGRGKADAPHTRPTWVTCGECGLYQVIGPNVSTCRRCKSWRAPTYILPWYVRVYEYFRPWPQEWAAVEACQPTAPLVAEVPKCRRCGRLPPAYIHPHEISGCGVVLHELTQAKDLRVEPTRMRPEPPTRVSPRWTIE